jgi:hypothetical protein
MSYEYVFASDYTMAQRGTSATPRVSGYGDMSSLGPLLGLGLVSTPNSPGPGPPDVLFVLALLSQCVRHFRTMECYVNVDIIQALDEEAFLC